MQQQQMILAIRRKKMRLHKHQWKVTVRDIYGAGEAALSVASGVLSSPVAGIAGIGELAVGGDLESATDVIERTKRCSYL